MARPLRLPIRRKTPSDSPADTAPEAVNHPPALARRPFDPPEITSDHVTRALQKFLARHA